MASQYQAQDNAQHKASSTIVTDNPWRSLRQFTDARVGLGRAGVSLPTQQLLEFQLAHAQAQDAVHTPLDIHDLSQQLQNLPWPCCQTPIALHSQAEDRAQYLQRPDLGRLLSHESADQLLQTSDAPQNDLAIVIVDGLSSRAVSENAAPFLQQLLTRLTDQQPEWQLAPISLVQQGRVAIGDPVGERLNARCVVVLIGERPGLSAPDSLGLYMTWNPVSGRTDAERNCISNIRPAGLKYPEAAHKTLYLLTEARQRQLSGVRLKDRSESHTPELTQTQNNFLTP